MNPPILTEQDVLSRWLKFFLRSPPEFTQDGRKIGTTLRMLLPDTSTPANPGQSWPIREVP